MGVGEGSVWASLISLVMYFYLVSSRLEVNFCFVYGYVIYVQLVEILFGFLLGFQWEDCLYWIGSPFNLEKGVCNRKCSIGDGGVNFIFSLW